MLRLKGFSWRLRAMILGIVFLGLSAPLQAGEFIIDIGAGADSLKYEEHVPRDSMSLEISSAARVTNVTVKGLLEYDFNNHFFVGGKGIVPVERGHGTEKWKWEVIGFVFQDNRLEYGWTRVDGYVGYSFEFPERGDPEAHIFEPYIGIRSSWVKQNRTNFVVLGVPVGGKSVEKVDSYGAIIGFRTKKTIIDDLVLGDKVTVGFDLKYVWPFDEETTNTAMPGFIVDAEKGYTAEGSVFAEYKYNDFTSFCIEVYGGRLHWKGSDWKAYQGGFVKWPENDTTYFGGNLYAKFEF
ncbi:MAG: hypothetical protein JW734_01280 [Candidatus Omnitrophica bacterium]|nr:hypothetical protein [Candidatus Omnitrophota bacterium]